MNEELRHFLEVEMERTREHQKDKYNPFYDGVCVGWRKASKLRRRHYLFCKRLLAMSEGVSE